MGRLPRQLIEDRVLRNTALKLVQTDIEVIRGEIALKSVGARAASRVGETAINAADGAADIVSSNKGLAAASFATAVGALGLWLARKPILEALHFWFSDDQAEEPEPDEDSPGFVEQNNSSAENAS